MKILPIAAACVAASIVGSKAHADIMNIYAGVSAGETETGASDAYNTADKGFKLVGGLRLREKVGVEISYADLGDIQQVVQFPDNADLNLDQTTLNIYGVYYHSIGAIDLLDVVGIGHIDLFAKAGLAKWNAKGSFSSFIGPTPIEASGEDFAWGVGVQAAIGDATFRVEYERMNYTSFFGNFRDPDFLSVGITWNIR